MEIIDWEMTESIAKFFKKFMSVLCNHTSPSAVRTPYTLTAILIPTQKKNAEIPQIRFNEKGGRRITDFHPPLNLTYPLVRDYKITTQRNVRETHTQSVYTSQI